MSTQLTTFFIVTMVVATLLVVGVVLALPRRGASRLGFGAADEPGESAADGFLPALPSASPMDEPATDLAGPSRATHDRILRILWWLTIAAVLIGVGLSGAFPQTQTLIFAFGLLAVAAVFVLHDVLSERWITPLKFTLEGLLATALVTGLLAATGYGSSPYFFGYYLIAVGAALALGRRATLVYAGMAALAYLVILYLDPAAERFTSADLLRFSLNIGSVWLVAYLAAVFASEERRARAAVVRLSITDPLTGLFNRPHAQATLEQEIRRTRRSQRGFSLLMIDLDGLKAVNDTRGHHRGDEVLKSLAAVIARSIRTVDTAARYGGDEFVVLLPETQRAGAMVVAEKIRAGAEDLGLGLDRDVLPTSVSIGLVHHPDDGATADELLVAADRAMYASKALGKNQISTPPERTIRTPLPALARAPDQRTGGRTVAVPVASDDSRPASPPADASAEGPPAAATSGGNGAAAAEPPAEERDEELDPAEARRRIARLSYDPDHQVRRAMDAFLSRPGRPPEEERQDRQS